MRNPITKLKSLFPWPDEKPGITPNLTGWFRSEKKKLLERVVPRDAKVILELGSWHGQSTLWFLSHCPNATVIAVDTWLGSVEHVGKGRYRSWLPTLYETFLVNCWEHRSRLIPVRNTSLMAMELLHQLGIAPDAVYFDAGHSYWEVTGELEMAYDFWPFVIMTGDDFDAPSIRQVLQNFCQHHDLDVEHLANSWHLRILE